MRVAAAVIGGFGATLGAFKGFNIVFGTLLLTVSGDDTGFNPLGLRGTAPGFDPFLVLWGSTEGGAAISCVLGMIGAGLVIAGRLRTGAWLMLAGAVGVVASAYTYIFTAGRDGTCARALPLPWPPTRQAVARPSPFSCPAAPRRGGPGVPRP